MADLWVMPQGVGPIGTEDGSSADNAATLAIIWAAGKPAAGDVVHLIQGEYPEDDMEYLLGGGAYGSLVDTKTGAINNWIRYVGEGNVRINMNLAPGNVSDRGSFFIIWSIKVRSRLTDGRLALILENTFRVSCVSTFFSSHSSRILLSRSVNRKHRNVGTSLYQVTWYKTIRNPPPSPCTSSDTPLTETEYSDWLIHRRDLRCLSVSTIQRIQLSSCKVLEYGISCDSDGS